FRLLLKNFSHIVVRTACMYNKWQLGPTCGFDVNEKTLTLRCRRSVVVVIIETCFAYGDNLRMFRKAHEIVSRNVQFFMRIVGMGTDGTIDGLIGFRYGTDRIEFPDPRGNRHHALDPGVERALHNGIALRLEIGKVEMTMAIDKHH